MHGNVPALLCPALPCLPCCPALPACVACLNIKVFLVVTAHLLGQQHPQITDLPACVTALNFTAYLVDSVKA